MAKVFIFDNAKRTGHAALELDDGTYVSFHPKTQSTFGPIVKMYPGDFSGSLAEDVESPDYRTAPRYRITEEVKLSGLHEVEMADAFVRLKEHTEYQFFTMNCSTVVAKLLIIGAGHSIIDSHISLMTWKIQDHFEQFFNKRHDRSHGRLTERAISIAESSVIAALKAMSHEMNAGRRVQPRSILPLVTAAVVSADIVARDFVWSPGEVLRFAEYIKEHLPSGDGRRSRW
jgi:hypothetical protein